MLNDQLIAGAVRRARADRRVVVLWDTGRTKGLELRVSAGGAAAFAMVATPKGEAKRRRYLLGSYSSSFGMGEARREAAVFHGKVAQGIDPWAVRDEAREAARGARADRQLTVAAVAAMFIATRSPARAKGVRRALARDLLQEHGSRPVADLKRSDVQRMVDAIVRRGSLEMARHFCAIVRVMLVWAKERDYITGEPWKAVDLPPAGEPRTRVLAAAEVKWLWERTEEWLKDGPLGNRNLALQVRLGILIGQRSEEISGMGRAEVDVAKAVWSIPAHRSKNRIAHQVPLPPQALEIIREASARSESATHVFQGARRPINSAGTAHYLADAVSAWYQTHPQAERVAVFTFHDLRRTMATGLEAMGVPEPVISACLNHVTSKRASITRRVYSHADLSTAKLIALARWQAVISAMLEGADPLAVRDEDRAQIVARALAQGAGDRPHLRVVW